MSLSCSCDFDYDGYLWFWMDHSNWKPIESKYRKRCCSCKEKIERNEDSIEFYRYRYPRNDIEERIHGEMVPLASFYMCEKCSGLYYAFEELGYDCLDISQSMQDYVIEYNEGSVE